MNETHTSYKVSKRLKEFLGESAPEPISQEHWCGGCGQIQPFGACDGVSDSAPAYQLHDLLSKPFCFAMADKMEGENSEMINPYRDIHGVLSESYFVGGLPAVESALMEMMK